VGRLKGDVTIDQAKQDMKEIAQNLAKAYPDTNKNAGIVLTPLKEQMVGNVRPMLLLLSLAVGLVLLIACANIANLLSTRSLGRVREFAVRAALGASRGRILRQLLVESALLGLIGGGFGFLLAVWATKAGLATLPEALPLATTVRVDQHVLLFTLLVSISSGILFSLTPMMQIRRADVNENLKEGKRSTSTPRRIQNAFVVAEMALAVVLLIGAGLMIRSLANLWSVHSGFNPKNVWLFGVAWPASTQKETPDQVRADLNRLTDTIATVPGVTAAAITDGAFPMAGDNEVGFWIEGQPKPATTSEMQNAMNYIVGPAYLKTMGIPQLEGRFLSREDSIHSSWVAVIDDQFKRQYFPTQDPLGQHIYFAGIKQPFEIVGVVGHVIQFGLDENEQSPVRSQVYTAVAQIPDEYVSMLAKSNGLVVRTETPTYASQSAIREAIQRENSQQIAYGFKSMEGIITDSLAGRRFTMTLLAIFAALAVLLASVGIYGVFSHVVSRRTYEFGIRMALGAERRNILMMVLRQAGRMVLLGLFIGLFASLGLTRLMASMLFEVGTYDPLTLLSVVMILSLVALIACYVPARRATRIDPMVALRYE
jgi:predicted permease